LEQPIAATAGTSDKQVQLAEITHCSGDCGLNVGKSGDIAYLGDRPPTFGTDVRGHLFQALSIAAHDHNSGPLGGQASCRGGAYSPTAPGDKSH
jgi:hypothetical protein